MKITYKIEIQDGDFFWGNEVSAEIEEPPVEYRDAVIRQTIKTLAKSIEVEE